ncbi:MAG: hypothetical protein IJE84_00590 [Clostridia bacterium]|nr:hypothetical protein [Clostridia bacterium]
MYISKKKRQKSTVESLTREIPAMSERLAPEPAETSDGEPLELERELFLEPEEEMTADELSGETHQNSPPEQEREDEDEEILVPDDPQDLDDGSENEERNITYEQFQRENTGDGVLRVQASAGGGSIPLSNVNIVVYRDFADGRHVFYTVVTNSDGVADGMILPAPPRQNSVEGNGQSPFSSYSVNASREGLRTEVIENVPVFSGVKSIQPINLAPSEREV